MGKVKEELVNGVQGFAEFVKDVEGSTDEELQTMKSEIRLLNSVLMDEIAKRKNR